MTSYYNHEFTDHLGKQIVVRWNKKLWLYHLSKHPELKDFNTASNLISQALGAPSIIMHCRGHDSTKGEEIICYYLEVKRHQSWITYIKVVVGGNAKPPYVKSVWQEQALYHLVIKERKYNYFKEIWKDPNSYL